ncbi:MAG: stage VI sporulation protein D [Longicatena sp.]
MKTMKIEKQLLFTDKIKEVVNLQVKDALTYQQEDEGIRALGPLFIKGQYKTDDERIQTFQEVLDMDVLAPKGKIARDDFYLDIQDYQGIAEKDGITLTIQMNIHGLIEDGSKEVIAANGSDSGATTNHVDLMQYEPKEHQSIQEEHKSEEDTSNEFEELFEDGDTTYTSYRMIVAKKEDSYDTIAKRYDVSVEDLRSTNKNKEVTPKTLVVLPFQN